MARLIPIRLSFRQLAPQTNVSISIHSPDVGWSLGRPSLYSQGVEWTLPPNLPAAVTSFQLDYSTIAFSLNAGRGGTVGTSFELHLFLLAKDDVRMFRGSTILNPGAEIRFAIDDMREAVWFSGLITAAW